MTMPAAAPASKRKPPGRIRQAKLSVPQAWPAQAPAQWFLQMSAMPAIDRVTAAKRGVPALFLTRLAKFTGESKEQLNAWLGFSRATVDRKARAGQMLSTDESARVIGFARLVGQVQTLVNESGDPTDFDAARWLAMWLHNPLPALAGRLPGNYMDTVDGQQMISDLLARARGGAFA